MRKNKIKEAYEKGYKEGYEKGYKEAYEKGLKDGNPFTRLAESLSKVVATVTEYMKDHPEEFEHFTAGNKINVIDTEKEANE